MGTNADVPRDSWLAIRFDTHRFKGVCKINNLITNNGRKIFLKVVDTHQMYIFLSVISELIFGMRIVADKFTFFHIFASCDCIFDMQFADLRCFIETNLFSRHLHHMELSSWNCRL